MSQQRMPTKELDLHRIKLNVTKISPSSVKQ